jgi:hypothetical protein
VGEARDHLDKGRGLVFGPRAFACHGDCIPGAPGRSWLTTFAWLSKLRCARFGGSSIPLGVRPPTFSKEVKRLVGKTGCELFGRARTAWACGWTNPGYRVWAGYCSMIGGP